jgi:hypothetical protein
MDGAFILTMLAVLARVVIAKVENKKSSVLMSWFSDSPSTGTQQN